MVDSRYYSIQQAAEILACDSEQILGFVHAGKLAAFNVARDGAKRPRWRIAEGDLGRFLLSRQHPAASETKPAGTRKVKPVVKQYV